MPKYLALVLILVAAGCARTGDEVWAEVMLTDESGAVVVEPRRLPDVRDIFQGQGAHYVIRGQPVFSLGALVDSAQAAEPLSFRELVKSSRLSLGAPLDLRLEQDVSQGHYVAQDLDSLEMTTTMYHVGNILELFRDTYHDDSGALDSPLVVGLDGVLQVRPEWPASVAVLGLDIAYQPFGDGIFLGRRRGDMDIPVTLSPGVLAHEVAHRFLFRHLIVQGPWTDWLRIFSELEFPEDGGTAVLAASHPAGADVLMYRAFDEGMANLFGGAYAQKPQIYDDVYASRPDDIVTQDNDHALFIKGFDRATCTIDQPPAQKTLEDMLLTTAPYAVGPPATRIFWHAADKDPVRVRDHVMPAVVRALPRIAAASRLRTRQEGQYRFLLVDALNTIAAELDAPERQTYCALLGCSGTCVIKTAAKKIAGKADRSVAADLDDPNAPPDPNTTEPDAPTDCDEPPCDQEPASEEPVRREDEPVDLDDPDA